MVVMTIKLCLSANSTILENENFFELKNKEYRDGVKRDRDGV